MISLVSHLKYTAKSVDNMASSNVLMIFVYSSDVTLLNIWQPF